MLIFAAGAPDESVISIPDEGLDLEKRLEEIERRYLLAAIDKTEGHLTNAAKLLGISFRAIRYKVKKYGLRESGVGEL